MIAPAPGFRPARQRYQHHTPRFGVELPTVEGRQLLVSPLKAGGLRLAIIGKQGSMVEATMIGVDQGFPFVRTVDLVLEISMEIRERWLAKYDRERDRRYREALKENGWLNPTSGKGPRSDPNATYIVRPR